MDFVDLSGHLLVICPHFDDACFSIGGFLLKRQPKSVTILSVFSKSQHAPNYRVFYPLTMINDHLRINFLKRTLVEVISMVRKKEDSQFCHQIGAIQSIVPFEDSDLRGCPAYSPIFNRTEIRRDSISRSVLKTIEKWVFSGAFDSILCPLGIGNQVDHLIVVNAILRILETKSPKVKTYFYEDLPYAAFCKLDLIKSLALTRTGSDNALYVDVTNEILLKLALTNIYRSQGQEKAPILKHAKRLFASRNNVSEKGFYERIWSFESFRRKGT